MVISEKSCTRRNESPRRVIYLNKLLYIIHSTLYIYPFKRGCDEYLCVSCDSFKLLCGSRLRGPSYCCTYIIIIYIICHI